MGVPQQWEESKTYFVESRITSKTEESVSPRLTTLGFQIPNIELVTLYVLVSTLLVKKKEWNKPPDQTYRHEETEDLFEVFDCSDDSLEKTDKGQTVFRCRPYHCIV